MRMIRRLLVLTLALCAGVTGIALGQPAAVAPGSAAAALAADTPAKTASGTTFTAPKEWSMRSAGQFVMLAAPEGDTNVAIVDVGKANDASSAVAQAWTLYRPDAHRPVKLVTPAAPINGWDERAVVEYETSPNEKATVYAIALRKGADWTVLIFDGHDATAEKRAAATALVEQSLRPAGYAQETFAGRQAHPLDAARIELLKSFVRTSMQQLDVPGVSIALYDHGRVVFEGGFGVREIGKPEAVDANTLYMIASNTKGLTTLMLARLVDQGKLSWDEHVTQVYPPFRLGSESTTQQVLIKHLICACTGIPRKDLQWILNTNPNTPASDTFVQLAATEPTSRFGEVFQYNNLMASAAGYIGGSLVNPGRELGAAYDAAMQNLIFDPLGMSSTTLDMRRALANPNHASPHADDVDGNVRVAGMGINESIIPYRPAGAAWSTVDDMIKYVEDELTPGKLPNGTQLVSANNVLQRRVETVPIGENQWYGMGLMVDKTWGVTVVHHGGDLTGFHSDWFAFTDSGVGAVILTNGDNGWAMRAPFMRRILEVLYDGRPEAASRVASVAAQLKAELAKERKRLVVPAAAALSTQLASRYVNGDLGHIDVTRSNGSTVFNFGTWSSQVASRINDDKTVSFITIDPGVDGFEFVLSTRNGHSLLIIRDGQHEYVYTQAPW